MSYVATPLLGIVFGIGLAAAFAAMLLFIGLSVCVDLAALGIVHEVFSVIGSIKAATIG